MFQSSFRQNFKSLNSGSAPTLLVVRAARRLTFRPNTPMRRCSRTTTNRNANDAARHRCAEREFHHSNPENAPPTWVSTTQNGSNFSTPSKGNNVPSSRIPNLFVSTEFVVKKKLRRACEFRISTARSKSQFTDNLTKMRDSVTIPLQSP